MRSGLELHTVLGEAALCCVLINIGSEKGH